MEKTIDFLRFYFGEDKALPLHSVKNALCDAEALIMMDLFNENEVDDLYNDISNLIKQGFNVVGDVI